MNQTFSPNLIKARMQEKRMTQVSLSEALGIDRATLNRWLNGKPGWPGANKLAAIANELDCSVSDFYPDAAAKQEALTL